MKLCTACDLKLHYAIPLEEKASPQDVNATHDTHFQTHVFINTYTCNLSTTKKCLTDLLDIMCSESG